MTELAHFLGIHCTFCTDFESNPHFHTHYYDHNAVIDIKTGGVVNGSLPPRIAGILCEWVHTNKVTLEANWEQLKMGNSYIAPSPPLVAR